MDVPDVAEAPDPGPPVDVPAADAPPIAEDVVAPPPDPGPPDVATPADPGALEAETDAGIAGVCFADVAVDPAQPSPNYDQFKPVLAKHCFGTNHQDIQGVEKVVFLGDSVTVGTPNLAHLLNVDNEHFWRNKLATWLAEHFKLNVGEPFLEWGSWKTYDYLKGTAGKVESGDFKSCAKWGARDDDFLEGGNQIGECFPTGGSDKRTLVVFTMGGNDVSSITKEGQDATPEEVAAGYPKALAKAQEAVQYLEDAVKWLKDPARFPKGSFVVFANPFEFTDGTGKTDSCTPQGALDIPGIGKVDLSSFDLNLAAIAGYKPWADPKKQAEIVIWLLEQYLRIAVDYQADMVFMLEHFCGHGYVATGPEADPENRCYLGPDAKLWFDETCIHPNPDGHSAIFEMFKAEILE